MTLKHVKTNSGQIHLNAAGHEGAAVFAHVAYSAEIYLDAVILNWKQPSTKVLDSTNHVRAH